MLLTFVFLIALLASIFSINNIICGILRKNVDQRLILAITAVLWTWFYWLHL